MMKQADILPVASQAAIDWSAIPLLHIDCPALTEPWDVAASAQICRDGEAFFLRLSACEGEIRAVEKGPLGMPCRDSCLEFFFCPGEGDSRYFNFEFNPNGCLFLGFGSGIEDQTRLLPAHPPEALFDLKIHMGSGGWEIRFQIPFAFVRRFFPDFLPAAGKSMRANFYKCAECTRRPHYLAWNPVTGSEGPVFHAPGDFGILRFV